MSDFDEQKALSELEKGYDSARKMLQNQDQVERFLQRLEKKLRSFPAIGEGLAMVPVFASLLKSYISREYMDIPIGSIIALVSALIYFVSPVDIIPDFIPGVGHVDDIAVIGVCLSFVKSDVDEYMVWRAKNNKVLDV